MSNGVQDVDERIERLQELVLRCNEEIARLRVRKSRALSIAEEHQRAQRVAQAPDSTVRAWAREAGLAVGVRGRVPDELRQAFLNAGGSVVRTERATASPPTVGASGRSGADHRAPNEPSGAPVSSTRAGAPAHA